MQTLFSLVAVILWGDHIVQSLSQCDPLDPSRCSLPFPNNFWLRPSPSEGGALRLQFTNETFPHDRRGQPIEPEKGGWNKLDGFSTLMPITTFFPTNKGRIVSLTNIPPYWNIERSLEDDCPTILLDAETGKKIPHWAELDHSSDNNISTHDRMFMLWPAKALLHNRRYIVAMRGLVDDGNNPIHPSSAFLALRDNKPSNDTDVEERRVLFADIFSRLDQAGINRSELQLCWDFNTTSLLSITGRMLHMRDDGFAHLPIGGPDFKVKSIQENVSSFIARQVEVTIQVPQYVNQQAPGARLVLDPTSGLPVYQKMASADISIRIPFSVAAGKFPASSTSVLQYGHGLFGSRSEAHNDYLMQEAGRHGYVVLSSDWIGMANEDEVPVGLMLATNLTKFGMVPDRSQQGFLRALVAMRLMMNDKFLSSDAMNFDGRQILTQKSKRFYFGNSQGGIFGTCYMALSIDVKRGCIGVGGGPYSLLLPRSSDFQFPLYDDLKLRYPNTLDRALIFPILQLLWDRADPGGYMSSVTTSPLPNTPSHEVILQHGLGDGQVTYVGVYTLGRSIGTSIFESNVHEKDEKLYGFPIIHDQDIGDTAMLVTWVFPNVPPVPKTNTVPISGDTHEGPRRQTDAQEMMNLFFQTGQIKNTCKGPCHGTHNFTTINQ